MAERLSQVEDEGVAPAAVAQRLAVLASNGDRAAFAELVLRQYDFIRAAAYRFTRHREMAEDVAQNVCMKLGGSIRKWRGEGAITTWLYRLTLNAAQDALRAQAREQRRMELYGSHMALMQGAIPQDQDGQANGLWQAVNGLPGKQRSAILLVYGEGLSHGEAAAVMECAEATVSFHVHAARKRLRDILERQEA